MFNHWLDIKILNIYYLQDLLCICSSVCYINFIWQVAFFTGVKNELVENSNLGRWLCTYSMFKGAKSCICMEDNSTGMEDNRLFCCYSAPLHLIWVMIEWNGVIDRQLCGPTTLPVVYTFGLTVTICGEHQLTLSNRIPIKLMPS